MVPFLRSSREGVSRGALPRDRLCQSYGATVSEAALHGLYLTGLIFYFAEGYRFQFDAPDLAHLVWTNNLDLPRRPFENESPGRGDPNVFASSHVDRVTADSVYRERLPFSGS